jgi:hypothetical protein
VLSGEGNLDKHDVLMSMLEDERPINQYLMVQELDAYSPDFRRFMNSKMPGTSGAGSDATHYRYNFPLMMVPVHGTSVSKNSYFTEALKLAKKELSEASLVISIGYNFGDLAFTNSLKELDLKDKELILVGTNEGAESLVVKKEQHPAYEKASAHWGKVRIFDGNGFTEFADSLY